MEEATKTEVYGTSEEVVYKAFTAKALVLGLIMGFVWVISQIIMGVIGGYMWTGEAAAAMMVVTYAVFSLLGGKARPEEYGVVYGITETACCAALGYQFAFPSTVYIFIAPQFRKYAEFLPSYMAPASKSVLKAAAKGGPVTWGEWAVPLAFYMILGLVLFMLSVFTILPFRRQVIEVERMPFPVATAAAAVVRITAAKEHPERAKWLWLGLLIGLVWGLLLPDSLLTAMGVKWEGLSTERDFTGRLQKVLPGSALMFPEATPDLVCWFYLIPLEVQITTFIASIFFYVILASIQVKAGWLSYTPDQTYTDYLIESATHGIGYWHLGDGLYLAIGVVPIFIAYRYLKDTLSRIARPQPDEKETEPMPYRYMWLGMAALFLIALGIFVKIGLPAPLTIIMLLMQMGYFHAYMRSIGMGDWMIPHGYQMRAFYDWVFFRTGVYNPNSKIGFITGWGNTIVTEAAAAGGVASMETFRFAFLTGMRPRDMFIAQVIGALFMFTIGLVLVVTLMHKFGGALATMRFMSSYMGEVGERSMRRSFLDWRASSFFGGFLLGAAIIVLRVFAPGFPLSVYGILFGLLIPRYGLLYLVTAIAKYLTLRYGGTKTYESIGVPFAAGLATGGILMVIFTAITVTVRDVGIAEIAGIASTKLLGGIFLVISLVPAIVVTIRAFTRK